MKKLLFLFFVLLTTPVFASTYDFKILKVVDGDTLTVEAPYLPKELGNTISIRIIGVDTPEKEPRANCREEAEKAKQASEFTKNLILNSKSKKIILIGWDKYGGRVLGDVLIDNKLLSKRLIDAKMAVPYDGGKKINWCEFLKSK